MDNDLPSAKRPRLSMACNECRRRKVRCDTDVPKCRNCRLRNDICITTDPKRPSVAISREWVEQSELQDKSAIGVTRNFANISAQSPGAWAKSPKISQSPLSTAVSASWSEDKGISPAQQPYEMAFNTDPSTDRIKMMGASSSQCLMKSFDIYLESAGIQPLSGNFRHGMRQAEEMEIPMASSPPALPEVSRRNNYVSIFFDKIHPLYPLFDIDHVKNTIQKLASLPDFHALPQEQVPLLVSAYLIVSLGADEGAERPTADGTKYLVAAASLVGHIILMPYLPTIQTLLLFTVVYRGRNKDGVGWQTLGMAIRVAYTLGLHRHSVKHLTNHHGVQNRSKQLFHARIWAICCSLEKMMQLESGRPALIHDVDRDHMMGPEQHPRGHDFVQWHVGLAKHQGLISHHIYGHKPGNRTGQQILSDTARLDRSLLSWAREIPEEFRPGNDLFCSNHEFHIAALLSIQYYQTVIALHRAALISPASIFVSEVAKYCFDDSSRLRLQAGEAICVSSARSIARLAIELSDRNIQSRVLTAGPQLLACIVLGISLMKNPGSRIMAADLELLKACVEYTADEYLKWGQNVLFVRGITSIYQQVQLQIDRKSNEKLTHSTTKPHILPELESVQQSSQQLVRDGTQIHNRSSSAPLYNDVANLNELNTTETVFENSASKNDSHNHADASLRNEVVGMDVTAPLPVNANQDMFSDALPFDNFNVQDLWTWMGDLDGYDQYSYQGSYDSNGTL